MAAMTKPKPMSKKDVHLTLADKTGLTKKEIAAVLDALVDLIGRELGNGGPGAFVVPGLLKLKTIRKPATKAKAGTNPFTGRPLKIAAKPARNAVKIVAMKVIKDSVL